MGVCWFVSAFCTLSTGWMQALHFAVCKAFSFTAKWGNILAYVQCIKDTFVQLLTILHKCVKRFAHISKENCKIVKLSRDDWTLDSFVQWEEFLWTKVQQSGQILQMAVNNPVMFCKWHLFSSALSPAWHISFQLSLRSRRRSLPQLPSALWLLEKAFWLQMSPQVWMCGVLHGLQLYAYIKWSTVSNTYT